MNKGLKSPVFWHTYENGFQKENNTPVVNILQQLCFDFNVRTENLLEKFQGDIIEYERTSLTFEFPLPKAYTLKLIVEVDIENDTMPEQRLFLADEQQQWLLGYQDFVHPMPYCLRLEELDFLEVYWKTQKCIWKNNPEIAWCLLAKFVGIDQKQDFKSLTKKYQAMLHSLEVKTSESFYFHKDCQWMKTKKGYEFLQVDVPSYMAYSDVEYDTEQIKYLSHSLRKNADFDDEDWNPFPFVEWDTVMDLLVNK